MKDPCSAVFELRYQPNFRVTAIFGDNRIEVQDEKGHKSVRRSSPSEKTVQQLPSKELLQRYGRSSKLLIPAKDIPNLQFKVGKLNTISKFQEHSENSLDDAEEEIEVIETSVFHQETNSAPLATLHNSDFCKHSRNSLKSVAGVALEWLKQDEVMQPSRSVREHDIFREFGKDSLNLWAEQDGRKMSRTGDTVREAQCEECLGQISEFEEHSLESWTNRTVGEVEQKLQTVPQNSDTTWKDCASNFSKPSQKLLEKKGNNVLVPKLSWLNSMTQVVGLTAAWHQGKAGGDLMGTNTVGSPKETKLQFMQSSTSFYETQ